MASFDLIHRTSPYDGICLPASHIRILLTHMAPPVTNQPVLIKYAKYYELPVNNIKNPIIACSLRSATS